MRKEIHLVAFEHMTKTIRVTPHIGETIYSAARDALILTLHEEATVTFDFNGTEVRVDAPEVIGAVVVRFEEARDKGREEK